MRKSCKLVFLVATFISLSIFNIGLIGISVKFYIGSHLLQH